MFGADEVSVSNRFFQVLDLNFSYVPSWKSVCFSNCFFAFYKR